jgi:hypothetical protein
MLAICQPHMAVGLQSLRLAPALLVFVAASGQAQEAGEIVRCRAIADDDRRLACYDAIATSAGSPLSKYEVVTLDELKEYALSYRGKLVETTGWLTPGGSYLFLGLDKDDARPMPVDAENLERRARETLLERCGEGCEATIQGRVRPVNFTTGIVADALIAR